MFTIDNLYGPFDIFPEDLDEMDEETIYILCHCCLSNLPFGNEPREVWGLFLIPMLIEEKPRNG